MNETENALTAALPEGTEIADEGNKNARVYRITGYLGRGGFGITYLAESDFYDNNILQTGRYTIKEFCMSDICTRLEDNSLGTTPGAKADVLAAMDDFEHAANRLKKMKHPGIVPVNEVFRANGTVYYVMQYLGDTPLQKYVARQKNKRLSEDEACFVIRKLAQAIGYLHKQRILHLDVKPDNVMMVWGKNNTLQPILIDFGLAAHYKSGGSRTSRGTRGTTEGYSPIEQYVDIDKYIPQADIYALGATFYYMLTGKAPAKASDWTQDTLMQNIKGLNLSSATTTLLTESMRKEYSERLQSIEEFLNILPNREQPGNGGNKPPKNDGGTITVPLKSNRPKKGNNTDTMKKAAVGLAALLVLAGGGVLLFNALQGSKKAKNTDIEIIEEADDDIDELERLRQDSIRMAEEMEREQAQAIADSIRLEEEAHAQQQVQQHVQQQTQQPVQQTETSSRGTVSLGFASYSGELNGGQPEGYGTMTFNQARRYGSYNIQAGDKIVGWFTDGQPESGTWYKSDGTTESISIGAW